MHNHVVRRPWLLDLANFFVFLMQFHSVIHGMDGFTIFTIPKFEVDMIIGNGRKACLVHC